MNKKKKKKQCKKFWFLNLKSAMQCHFLGTAYFCNSMLFLLHTLQTVVFYFKKKLVGAVWAHYYIWVGWFSWKEILRMKYDFIIMKLHHLYVGSNPISLKPQCRNCCLVEPKGAGIPRGITLGPSPVLHTFSSTSSSISSIFFCVPVVPPCIPEQTIPFL